MSSRLKLRPHQKRRSGKPYERKSVLEKVKDFFTPSYWFGGEGATDDDAMPHADDETRRHIFNPPYSHPSDSLQARQNPQGDVIIIDGTQSDRPVAGLSVGTEREKSSEAWKRNMISLNEDVETGPSQLSQNVAGSSMMSSSESTSVNALHNTKLFIPVSSNAPQHSTPLKTSDQISMQPGSDSTSTNVLNEMDTVAVQCEDTTAETRKESTPSSSAVAPRFESHPSGSMLTPPDSPTPENHSAGNRSRTQSHLTSILSPGRFNIPQGQGPLRSPYYSGRTTFGGASSQMKMRTVKRRRSEDDQRSPELPPVRQQLHARPATHQTVVASQTAKQILESLKNYSTPVSNAKRFPIRSPVTPLMSPKESVVPAAKRHRIKPNSADKQHGQVSGPPVNPLLTPYKAHIMTLPPVTPPTDDRLHLNPVTMTTTAQPTSTHSSEPHPLATAASMNASSLSSTAPGLLASNIFSTSEVARVKEKPQDVNQPVSKGFTTGWVGGASRKIKEKKYSMHEGNKDDEQINPMEMPKAIPLQLSSSGKLPSFTFTPAFVQKKGKSDNTDQSVSKEADITSVTTGMSVEFNFSQPKTITTATLGSEPSTSGKELVKFSFSTPKQHGSEVALAVSSVSLPMSFVSPKVSLPTQFNPLPSTQPLLLSGSSFTAVKSFKSTSERKPLPLKSGSCLDILKPSKLPVEDKTVKDDTQSKPPVSAGESSSFSQKFKQAEGSRECPTTDDTTSRPGNASTTAAALTSIPQQSSLAQKFKPAEGSWECPTCMINNKTTDSKCVACTTSRPGSAPTATTTTAGPLTASSAPQQSSFAQKFKPAEGSWECPTCMVNNKTTDSKCVACTTSRPGGPASTPATSSGLSKEVTLGSGTGLQFGSSGGMKLDAMKDGGMLKVSSTGGFKLGSSGGLNLGSSLKSESAAVSEPASGGFKLGQSGGFKLGASGGFKLGASGDLKLGLGGDLKLGSSSDSKLVGNNTVNLDSGGGGLKLGSSSALQLGSTNSSSIIVTTTITSGFTSSSIVSQSLSSRPGSVPSTSFAEGNTSTPAPGIKFGGLMGSQSSSSGGGDNLKPTLLSGQQSSAQLTLKPLDTSTVSTDNSGLKMGGVLQLGTSGGLQLGASGGLKLGISGGLQLGSGGFQSGSSSSGMKLGLPTSIQPASGEAMKLTGENTSMTGNTEGMQLGKKRPRSNVGDEGASNVEPVIGNKSLVGVPMVLPPLNRPPVTTAKSVTFKLDSDNTNTDTMSVNKQSSFNTPQPSLVAGSGVLTSGGFTLGGSLTSTGDRKLPAVTSESSAVKPFANLFSNSSTTNSNVMNFGFPKLTSMSTLATTTSTSTLQIAPLSGMSSVTSTAAESSKIFNFSQQTLFTTPGQGQSGPSGGLDLKLPTCQENKNISGNVTFNFSGAKSNELSQGQQGLSTGLGLTQTTSQPGFNFHAAMQNQSGSIFSSTMGSSLTGNSTTNSGLFPNQLGANQADNASGMEISNPATGEPQHLSNLTGLGGPGLQLQFGNNSNTTQPFVFNSQVNTNQPNMFEGASSHLFGANNSVLGNELPANMIFSATPSIAARPMKKAKRRCPK